MIIPMILTVLLVIALVLHILWTHLANQPTRERLAINLIIIVLVLLFAYFLPVIHIGR